MDDIILNKVAIIERCIKRIKEEYADDELNRNSSPPLPKSN